MKRFAPLVLGLAVYMVPTLGMAQAKKTVAAGKTSEIAYFTAAWDKYCKQGPMPTITVSVEPSHGTLTRSEAPRRFDALLQGGSQHCKGTVYDSYVFHYTPAAGYRGPDKVSFISTSGRSGVSVARSIAIAVK